VAAAERTMKRRVRERNIYFNVLLNQFEVLTASVGRGSRSALY
jgi:hypothetical protein